MFFLPILPPSIRRPEPNFISTNSSSRAAAAAAEHKLPPYWSTKYEHITEGRWERRKQPTLIHQPHQSLNIDSTITSNCPFLFELEEPIFLLPNKNNKKMGSGDVHFHPDYLSSNRGVTKILQIVLGFVVCSVLCSNWYGGTSCFGEGRIGYVSGLNFVVLLINIILFLFGLFNLRLYKAEQLYNVIATILFLVGIALLLWFMIQYNFWGVWMIIAMICIVIIFLLFQWDFKGNRTMSDGHLPI